MSISSEIIRRVAALKLPRAAMSEVLAILADVQAAEEKRLADQRERTRKSRACNVTVTLPSHEDTVTNDVTDDETLSPPFSPKKVSPSKPLQKITPPTSSIPFARENADDWPIDFAERFWKAYPRKAGKSLAIRKLLTIRKTRKVEFAALMAGVDRYASACLNIETQYQKHPATWLNAGCWDDDAAALVRSTGPPRNGGPQGFESLFPKPDAQNEQPDRPEYDLDLTANPAG